MIPVQTQRSVETSPVAASASFGISQNDVAHILTMLRDTLYSDRVLAVLREYAANAWDVHREVGKGDVPIQVTLPTLEAPTLEIRDFGTGISREDMLGRFLMAGASTKRNSNIAVGTLGIGRLSGFAYGDSFVVESRHAGVCSTYVAVIDASERGRIDLLDEQPATDTGLAIRLAVRAADIAEFREKAKRLFAYMHPRPTVNFELPAMGARFGDGVLLDEEDAGWSAVMGCVSYPIDLNQINPARFVHRLSGVLYFDIGTLHFSASREALKYTDQTKRALKDKLNTFLDDYVRSQLAAIESQATSPWDRRLRLLRLRRFELPWLKLDTTAPLSIELPEFKTFSLCTRDGRKKYKATKLDVHPATRFVLCDDKRALSGFRFGLNDYIATPEAEYTWVDAELSLGLLVSDLQIEGIPIVRTSALPWTAPPRRVRSNIRNISTPRGRAFRLRPAISGYYCQPYSRYWEPVRRDAEASDVYVTLNAFRCDDFYAKYRDDAAICAALKLGSMPAVYGYKCRHAPAVGQKYETWRSAFLASSLKMPHVQELLAQLAYVGSDSPSGDATAAIEERLGADHPVARLCRRTHEANKMPFEVKHALRDLLTQTNAKHPTADTSALRRYPLLAVEGIAKLWGNHAAAWLDYVAGKKRAK